MTFFPLPDEFYADPQFTGASDAAVALWSRAASWSAHHLTDGFVPSSALLALQQRDDTAAVELVDLRAWKRARGGFRFVYWPKLASKAYVEAKREAARTRQEKARRSKGVTSRRDSRVSHGGSHEGSHTSSHGSQSSPSLPSGERGTADAVPGTQDFPGESSSPARAAAQAKALAVANCALCDDDGYLGTQLCVHDLEAMQAAAEASARGLAEIRAQLAARPNGRPVEASAVAADAAERARARDRAPVLNGFLADQPDGGGL